MEPNITTKPDYEEQQCFYCKEWYPAPVSLYHTEAECVENGGVPRLAGNPDA